MKKLVVIAAAALFTASLLAASTSKRVEHKTHRVVFDASTPDESWDGILNNVENLQTAFGAESVEIEVVVHGKALGLVLANNEKQGDRVTALIARGVVFAACRNTMARQKVTPDQLRKGVTTVDSGVAEVVRKQEAGWAYVRAGA